MGSAWNIAEDEVWCHSIGSDIKITDDCGEYDPRRYFKHKLKGFNNSFSHETIAISRGWEDSVEIQHHINRIIDYEFPLQSQTTESEGHGVKWVQQGIIVDQEEGRIHWQKDWNDDVHSAN